MVCGGGRSRRHINSSKQQESLPYRFAVTVIVVALGRPLYLLCFPAGSELVSAASDSTDQPQNPSIASMYSSCILPGVVLVIHRSIVKGNSSKDNKDNDDRKEVLILIVRYLEFQAVGSNPPFWFQNSAARILVLRTRYLVRIYYCTVCKKCNI